MKTYTFKYGMQWLAARGGSTAKYRSSSEEQALKQFALAHPEEYARGDYKRVCGECKRSIEDAEFVRAFTPNKHGEYA